MAPSRQPTTTTTPITLWPAKHTESPGEWGAAEAPALQISQWTPDCHSGLAALILLFDPQDYSLCAPPPPPVTARGRKARLKRISMYPPVLSKWDVRSH